MTAAIKLLADTFGELQRFAVGLAVRMAKGERDLVDDLIQLAAIEVWTLGGAQGGAHVGAEETKYLRARIVLRMRWAVRTERRQGMRMRKPPAKSRPRGPSMPPRLNLGEL